MDFQRGQFSQSTMCPMGCQMGNITCAPDMQSIRDPLSIVSTAPFIIRGKRDGDLQCGVSKTWRPQKLQSSPSFFNNGATSRNLRNSPGVTTRTD
jgi:hypothetical protein